MDVSDRFQEVMAESSRNVEFNGKFYGAVVFLLKIAIIMWFGGDQFWNCFVAERQLLSLFSDEK